MEDIKDLKSLIELFETYEPFGPKPRPKSLRFIKDYTRFLSVLRNINNMVGMEQAKTQITIQIKGFVVSQRIHSTPLHGNKLHTLIYGPPGCGKTQLGRYLAELWAVSGCLNSRGKLYQSITRSTSSESSTKPPPIESPIKPPSDNHQLSVQNDIYRRKIRLISETGEKLQTNINRLRRKVRPRSDNLHDQVQREFQTLKVLTTTIDELSHFTVLPITVPEFPGGKQSFGTGPFQPIPFLPGQNITSLPPADVSPVKFAVFTRGDLIGKFQGHSTAQVRAALEEYVGGVLMIDEAYLLVTDERDTFGREILMEIINVMTLNYDKIALIFSGYRKDMEDSVLTVQSGLARRFCWTFDITGYSAEEIFKIFEQQLNARSCEIVKESRPKIETFFKEHVERFPHYGGDTENLCSFLVDELYSSTFALALDDNVNDDIVRNNSRIIDIDMFTKSFEIYLKNSPTQIKHRSENNISSYVAQLYR